MNTLPAFSTWSAFLAWPAGASLLYLMSAASLLGGAAWILGPGSADASRLIERGILVATVAIYVAALGLLSWLVARWQRGNPDAIALLVLLAVFLPGMPACFTALSQNHPGATCLLGVATLFQTIAIVRAVNGPVCSTFHPAALGLLGVMQLWNCLSPGFLGLAYGESVRPEFLLGHWLPGWWVQLLAGFSIVLIAGGAGPRYRDELRPCLRRAGLLWILTLVAIAASGLHQWLLTYGMNLELRVADHLGLAVVLALGIDAGAYRWRLLSDEQRAGFAWMLGLIGCVLAMAGAFDSRPVFAQLPCYPPAWLALGAIGYGLHAWRFRDRWAMVSAGVWSTGAAMTWGNVAGDAGVHAAGFGIAAVLWTIVAAAITRRWQVAAVAAGMLAIGALFPGRLVSLLGMERAILGLAIFALLNLAVSVIWWRSYPAVLRALAAGVLALAVLDSTRIEVPLVALALIVATGMWCRQRLLLVLAPITMLEHAWAIASALAASIGGWAGIIGAFALLVIGGWLSWRKARTVTTPST